MTSPTRAQLDAILRKYYIYDGQKGIIDSTKDSNFHYVFGLLEELRACWTPPSREALDKILDGQAPATGSGLTARPTYIVLAGLADKLMALMTGQPERVWCEHIIWKPNGGGYWFYEDQRANPYGHRHSIRPEDHWDQCPVQGCHAPRPSEG